MEVKPVVLTGKYVRLEPMTEAHVPGLTAIGLEDSIWEHMLYGDDAHGGGYAALGAGYSFAA